MRRYETVFSRVSDDGEGGGGSAWIPGFSEAFCKALDDMEQDSSAGLLAGVKILGTEGDVSLEDAIPKYVQQHQQQQQQQPQTQLEQQLLANALQAEAEIFYSCSSRDLSFLRGAHEPYHLGESGDYIMTQVGFTNPFYNSKPLTLFRVSAHALLHHGHCRGGGILPLLLRASYLTCNARRRPRGSLQRQQRPAACV
jgi:hypothetical protein